jgi:hypothetical protein
MKVSRAASSRPVAAMNKIAKVEIWPGNNSGAHAGRVTGAREEMTQ